MPPGESATCTTAAGASFGPNDPYLSRKSSGTPTTITRSASAKRERACPGDQQRVAARQHAARLAVGDHREAQRLRAQPGGDVRAAQPDVGAEHENGAVRRREQRGDPGHVLGAGLLRREQGTVGEVDGRLAVDRLQREVDEDRAAVRGRRQAERIINRGGDAGDGVLGPRALGDRGEQRNVVHLLQCALAPQVVGGAAAEHDDRGAVEPRGGHRAHAVRDPRAGRDHGEAGGPGQARDPLGGEHGGLLVPHVHQAQRRVGLDRAVVEREHVPAGEGEHGRHAVPLRDRDGVGAGVSRERAHPADVTRALRVCGGGHRASRTRSESKV